MRPRPFCVFQIRGSSSRHLLACHAGFVYAVVKCGDAQIVLMRPLARPDAVGGRPAVASPRVHKQYAHSQSLYQNVVVVEVPGVSREEFEALMPRSALLLRSYQSVPSPDHRLAFWAAEYRRFSSTSPHPRGNCAAAYAGCDPREAGLLHATPDPAEQRWVWDVFRDAGFATLVSEGRHDDSLAAEYERVFRRPAANLTVPEGCVGALRDHTLELCRAAGIDPPACVDVPLAVGRHSFAVARDFLRRSAGSRRFALASLGDASRTLSAAARGIFLQEADETVHAFLEDLLSSSTLLSDQSLVMIVSDIGTAQDAPSAEAIAHASQPLLWMATSHRMTLSQVDMRNVLFNNGFRLVSHTDVYSTLAHAAAGLLAKDGKGGESGYASEHGRSLLMTVPDRECGEPPFALDTCACAWNLDCRADRPLGHSPPGPGQGTLQPEPPAGGARKFEDATAAFIGRQIDGARGGAPCVRPKSTDLVVVACPQPGVLFDFKGQAWFELRIRSTAGGTGSLYSVRGYLEAGFVFVEAVMFAHPHDKMWDICVARSAARGDSIVEGDISDELKQLCECADDLT